MNFKATTQQCDLLFVIAAELLDQVNKMKMVSMSRMSLAARHKMNMIDEDVKVACWMLRGKLLQNSTQNSADRSF